MRHSLFDGVVFNALPSIFAFYIVHVILDQSHHASASVTEWSLTLFMLILLFLFIIDQESVHAKFLKKFTLLPCNAIPKTYIVPYVCVENM